MGLLTAVGRSLRYAGFDAVREFASRTYHSVRPAAEADPVLDADWDLLVVLDACRADLFEEVVSAGDYPALPAGETRTSPGSSSVEWLERVFGDADDEAVAEVAYVSGNPYTETAIDADRFAAVDEVWRDAWDDEEGTIPPRPITDRAISLARERTPERLVVHYMQPHFPSLASDDDDGIALSEFGERSLSVWEELRYGHRDEAAVWEAYRGNLELVLGEVEALLSNVDAERAVVTADHGNAVGEHHIYGHADGVALPCLREVPWSVTSATDERTRTPEDAGGADGDVSVDEKLRSLGYRT
jgi:hypothetical protein